MLQTEAQVLTMSSASGNIIREKVFFNSLNALCLFIGLSTCILTFATSFVFLHSVAVICAFAQAPGGTAKWQ